MTTTADPFTEGIPAAPGELPLAVAPATAAVAPVRTRRSGIWLAAAIALVLVGAVAGVFVYSNAGNSTQVFVAATSIDRGTVITKNDLTTISITAGQTTSAIPIDEADTLVGEVASTDIPAGGLLTPDSVTSTLTVPDGQALVGLTLKTGQMPAQRLTAGQQIVLVPVPTQGATATATVTADQTTPATVSQVSTDAAGNTIVDVYVSAQAAPDITAQAAAGNIAVYVTPGSGE